ncbi:MAG: hypothetical protein JW940_22735 [Polyangiaceae bacterium]|nr:hypothetical protein [Polyangiaceae bacterium]
MRHPRLFWAILLPVAGASSLAVWKLAPALAPRAASAAEIAQAFVPGWAHQCAPEPVEQTAYVLAVVVPIALACAITALLRRLRVFQREHGDPLWVAAAAVLAQLLLVGCVGYASAHESEHPWVLPPRHVVPVQTATVLCFAGWFGLRWQPLSWKARWASVRLLLVKWPGLAWLAAIGWALARLLQGVFADHNVASLPAVEYYHLPVQMGEFAAAVNGLVPLVDFRPQYENLLGLLLRPAFSLTGFNLTTFTSAMAALALIGFLLVYRVFVRVSGSPWIGLLMYVPWVAVSLVNMDPESSVRTSTFNYYAVGPIRYFGLFVLAFGTACYLAVPRLRRLVVVSCIAGLVVLNNLDFGVPAAAGLWLTALLFPPPDPSRIRQALRASAVVAGGVCLAFVVYWVVVRLACGSWPHAGALIEYQRTFAVLGFNMIAMPKVGLHWVFYATFMTAALYAVFVRFSESAAVLSFRRRLSTGMLAYGGVAGLGSAAYYVGRSHPQVLATLYAAWAFVAALLTHRVLSDAWAAKKSNREGGYSVYAIPVAMLLALWGGLLPFVFELPSVRAEVGRLVYPRGGPVDLRPLHLVSLVNKYRHKGEPAVILYPDGHWLAIRASVKNLCPFAHPDSVLLQAQLGPVFASIERLPRQQRYVFGRLNGPITDRLSREGFARVDADADFEVWTDAGSRTAASAP